MKGGNLTCDEQAAIKGKGFHDFGGDSDTKFLLGNGEEQKRVGSTAL